MSVINLVSEEPAALQERVPSRPVGGSAWAFLGLLGAVGLVVALVALLGMA